MCTLTLIPFRSGLRLVMNRDELLTRAPALAPSLHRLDSGRMVLRPIDPQSGGTWIAASDAGLMLALMNGNPRPMPALPAADVLRSRGGIVPALIGHRSARGAIDALSGLGLSRYAPFRLVAAGGEMISSAVWDGSALRIDDRGVGPACFVSSGLGDERVVPRLGLFNDWIARGSERPTAEAQDAFHRHVWPDRPEISVMMRRDGARTVSVTTIEPRAGGAFVMSYSCDGGSSVESLPPLMLEASQAR